MNLELKDNNGEQKISIIIPTYNNGESLFRLLNSIEKNKTNYEIIAIDKFSTDNTKEYCENFKVKLFQSNFLRSKAKNFGASMASSKYILFLDSDMEISENLLDIILDKLKEYDALCIKEESIGKNFLAKIRDFERKGIYGDIYLNVARAFRKDIFFICGGYDETLEAGEDLMLQKCLIENNFKIGWIDTPIRHHEEDVNIIKFIRKNVYYASFLKKIKKDEYWMELTSIKRRLKALKTSIKHYDIFHSLIFIIGLIIIRFITISSLLITKEGVINE